MEGKKKRGRNVREERREGRREWREGGGNKPDKGNQVPASPAMSTPSPFQFYKEVSQNGCWSLLSMAGNDPYHIFMSL